MAKRIARYCIVVSGSLLLSGCMGFTGTAYRSAVRVEYLADCDRVYVQSGNQKMFIVMHARHKNPDNHEKPSRPYQKILALDKECVDLLILQSAEKRETIEDHPDATSISVKGWDISDLCGDLHDVIPQEHSVGIEKQTLSAMNDSESMRRYDPANVEWDVDGEAHRLNLTELQIPTGQRKFPATGYFHVSWGVFMDALTPIWIIIAWIGFLLGSE